MNKKLRFEKRKNLLMSLKKEIERLTELKSTKAKNLKL